MTLTDTASWLEPTTIISVIGALLAIVLSVSIPTIVKRHLQKYLDEKDAKNAELEQLRHEKRRVERKSEIREIVLEGVKPIQDHVVELDAKVDDIKESLRKGQEASVVQMRVTMMELHDRYMKQGYANVHDKSTWDELYSRYSELGGNHFSEYVNRYKEDIDKLPSEKCKKTTKK